MSREVLLIKSGQSVGEAVILSDNNVVYHLWKDLRQTRYCTLPELNKKFKLQDKVKGQTHAQ